MPRISVVVPAWNAAATIETAVRSVLSQGEVPLECVIVDDGSTDDTGSIAEAMAAQDPRLIVIRSPSNEGVSAARNRALDAAGGEWLLFLDADDRLLPGAIRSLLRAAMDNDALVAIGQRVSTNGKRTWVSALHDLPDIREPGRKSIARNPGLLYYAGPVGKLIHRSCTTGLRFDGRVMGDQPWVLRALLRAADRIVVIADDVYEWRRPHRDHDIATITSSRERSARLGAEAASMAAKAYVIVSAEVERTVEAAARPTVQRSYFERLIRADLARQLSRAVKRADPDIGGLFAGMATFLATPPRSLLVGSEALLDDVILPPLRRWSELPRSARGAYWEMASVAVDADPGLVAKIHGRGRRAALRAARLPLVGHSAADILMASQPLTAAVRHPLRALVRTKRLQDPAAPDTTKR